jgi:hypothetical protein
MGIECLQLRDGARRKVCRPNDSSGGSDECHELPKGLACRVATIGQNVPNSCVEVGMMTTVAPLGARRHRADEAANLLFGVRCVVMRYPNAVEEDARIWG